jgi:16S rRNA (guanine966-N2)-methyltransferase
MRVVAGVARGVSLTSPRGAETRPITDRVKETLFAIVGEQVIDATVLDLYAGSGAIGIEALSRGAAHATFVERGRDAVSAIRANLERTRLAGAATVVAADVAGFLATNAERRYTLAFLDPPYDERAILAPLQRLTAHLVPGATVVVKHFWRTEIPLPGELVSVRERRFGETMLTFLSATGPGGERRETGTNEEDA